MKGEVGVQSQPQQGSRFCSTFPLASKPDQDRSETSFEGFTVKPWLPTNHETPEGRASTCWWWTTWRTCGR